MRRVGLSDIDVAARAVMCAPRENRTALAEALIQRAHDADLWRKRFGSAHPGGGTGSLYAQACLVPRAASSHCDAAYCAALAMVLDALAAWRERGHQEM